MEVEFELSFIYYTLGSSIRCASSILKMMCKLKYLLKANITLSEIKLRNRIIFISKADENCYYYYYYIVEFSVLEAIYLFKKYCITI